MFGVIKNLAKRSRKLSSLGIVKKILRNSGLRMDILELNQEQMYDEGIDAKGQPLGEYAPMTLRHKLSPGPHDHRTDHITLKDMGDFYNSMRLKNEKTHFVITGDMEKSSTNLETIYPYALGLTEKNIGVVRKWVRPIALQRIKEALRK